MESEILNRQMRQNTKRGVDDNDKELMEQIKIKLRREQDLSIRTLNTHIYRTHPKNKHESICKMSLKIDTKIKNKLKISDGVRDVGIGSTMYLMFLKSLRNMFVILTIINLPIILIYSSGEGTLGYTGFDRFYGAMNLGNLGENNLKGFRFHIENSKNHKGDLQIKCQSGKLTSLSSIGLLHTEN